MPRSFWQKALGRSGLGEREDELGSLAEGGVDGDPSLVGVEDAAGGGEAEACAAGLGGEVRAEDFLLRLRVDPRAGVDDVDPHGTGLVGFEGGGGAEDEFAGLVAGRVGGAHGLEGVEEEVEDGLLDESGIDVGGEGARGEVDAEANLLFFGLWGEEVGEFVEEGIEVGGVGIEAEFAGVFEEVGEDGTEAFDFAAEGGVAAREAFFVFVGNVEIVDPLGEELGVEADGGEGVFDLVGEAAGHGTEFGEAFGGASALLGGADALDGTADGPPRGEGGGGDAGEGAEGEHGERAGHVGEVFARARRNARA